MSPRMKTIVYLNPRIIKEARALGLHISMIANDCLEQAVKKMKKSPTDFPARWKLKPDKDMETEWLCYVCGTSFGVTGKLEGAKLGKCPTCGAEQIGSGVAIIPKETTAFLRKLEKRMKDQQQLKQSHS